MSPRRRNSWIAVAVLAFCGLAVGAFLATHERVEVQQPTPPNAEARANPLHGLTLALRAAGQTVETKGHLALRREPPPRRGTLVLLYPEAQVETADDADALMAWVAEGGRLVLPMPRGETAPALADLLRDELGVEALRGAAAAIDCAKLVLPGHAAPPPPKAGTSASITFQRHDGVQVVCGTPFAVSEAVDARRVWPKAAQARLARLPYGDGEVVVAGSLDLLENPMLSREFSVGDEADASKAARRRDGRTAVVAQLAASWLEGDAVWLVAYRGGSLSALLAREGWPFFLGSGLALLAWLLRRSQRLGPLVPSPMAHRRALMEHIEAAGQFAFRSDHGAVLHARLREAVLERLALRHALARLDDDTLATALADRSRLPVDTLRRALALPRKATHEQFRDAVATLTTVLHRL